MAQASLKKLWNMFFGNIDKDEATIKDFLKKTNLAVTAPAIGVPFFWPRVELPHDIVDEWKNFSFFKCNGGSFDTAKYKALYQIYPSGRLPDLRGVFPRFLDDGRKIDDLREVLTMQEATILRLVSLDNDGKTSVVTGGSPPILPYKNVDSITLDPPPDASINIDVKFDPKKHNGSVSSPGNYPSNGSKKPWVTTRPINISLNVMIRGD